MIRSKVGLITWSDFLLRPILPLSRALKWFCPEVLLIILPVLVFLNLFAVALCVFNFGINYDLAMIAVTLLPCFSTSCSQRTGTAERTFSTNFLTSSMAIPAC